MDDAVTGALIQETRQVNEPARMVGSQSNLETSAFNHMDVEARVTQSLRPRGAG